MSDCELSFANECIVYLKTIQSKIPIEYIDLWQAIDRAVTQIEHYRDSRSMFEEPFDIYDMTMPSMSEDEWSGYE
jgi:hypothetical protein